MTKRYLAGALVCAFACPAMAQIATLQIKVVQGEGAVHAPGSRAPRPLTVEVTDESGKPVAGAAVSFQLPPEGASGLFSNGLRTDLILTGADGRASVPSMTVNRTNGPMRIRITAVKEQARAGIIVSQSIGEGQIGESTLSAPAAPTPAAPGTPAPPRSSSGTVDVTPTPTRSAREISPTMQSGEITPTNARMAPTSHKKLYVLAAIAVAGGVAALAIVRSTGSKGATSPSSSTVSIGTPNITVGGP